MEANDLLTDQMQVRGPERLAVCSLALDGAYVGGEGIEPDVENVVAFDGKRNAPLDCGPADGEVAQALPDERDYFIPPRFGQDEIGLLVVQVQQAIRKPGEFKKVILLCDRLRGTAAVRTW